jgi:hypothetical protein
MSAEADTIKPSDNIVSDDIPGGKKQPELEEPTPTEGLFIVICNYF